MGQGTQSAKVPQNFLSIFNSEMIKYINLTIYILILLTIVIIISRRDIIEKYVNITKFGEFKDCGTCEDGRELKGCSGLNRGGCEPCEIGWAGEGGECNKCPINTYQDEEGRTNCKSCFVKLKEREGDGCEYYNNCSDDMKGDCSEGYVFVCGAHSNIYGKNRSKNGLAYYNSSYAGIRYLNSIYTIPFNFGNNYIKQVSCGYSHIVYLNNDNKLYGSGNGKLFGMGTRYYETPIEINAKYAEYNYDEDLWNDEYEYDNQIIKISASNLHTLFLHNNGYVYCCGYDDYSQLGTYNSGFNNLIKIQRYYDYNFDEVNDEYIVNKIITPEIIDISAGLTMSLFLDNNYNVYISTGNMLNGNMIYFKNYGNYKEKYGPLLLDKSNLGNGKKKINANFPGYISTNDKIYKFYNNSFIVFEEEFDTINNIKNIYSGGNILYVTTTDNTIYSCCVDTGYSGYPYSRLGRPESNLYQLEEVINDEKKYESVKEINIGDKCTMILYNDGTVYGCGQNGKGVLSNIGNRNYDSYKLKLFDEFGDIKINNICGKDFSIFVRKA